MAVVGVITAGLEALGPVALGVMTKYVKKEVNSFVDQNLPKVTFAAMGVLIGMGDQVIRVIDHFENAYRTELDYTLDKTSLVAQGFFNQIVSVAEEFISSGGQLLQKGLDTIQAVVHNLPFVSQESRYTSVKTLCFVVTDLSGSSTITFEGVFPCASYHLPTLTFGSTECKLRNTTESKIEFFLPFSIFGHLPNNKYTPSVTGQLNAPWTDSWNPLFAAYWPNSALYQVTLTALPRIAGTITHARFKSITTVVNVVQEMRTIHDSQKVKKNNTPKAIKYTPDPGCTFDTVSKPSVVTNPTDYSEVKVECTKDIFSIAVYTESTKWVTYNSTIKVIQNKTVEHFVPGYQDKVFAPPLEIVWGEPMIFTPPGLSIVQFTFVDFRGGVMQFAPPNFGSFGFLNIKATSDGGAIVTADISLFTQTDTSGL